MKHLTGFIISTLILVVSCATGDDYDSFYAEDTKVFNEQIQSAILNKEPWIRTPLLIVNKFFGPQYQTEGNSMYALEQVERTNDFIKVIVTQEGFLEDEVYGEKRIIEFTYKDNNWIINSIRVGIRCQTDRGHDNYTGSGCS